MNEWRGVTAAEWDTGAGELNGTEYDVLGRRELASVELVREVEHGPHEALRQEHPHPPLGIASTTRQPHETVVVVDQRTPDDLTVKHSSCWARFNVPPNTL